MSLFTRPTPARLLPLLRRPLWLVAIGLCLVYGLYAFVMAGLALLAVGGLASDVPQRAAPLVFIVHALAGGLALLVGLVQLARRGPVARPPVHRALGRLYVWAIWLASPSGLWLALVFDVSVGAKLGFVSLAVLWLLTTTIAARRIRQRRIAEHRVWMIRSYALSLFFVTFSLWPDLLALSGLPSALSYPLAVFLSWTINLAIAELWLWRTSTRPPSLARE